MEWKREGHFGELHFQTDFQRQPAPAGDECLRSLLPLRPITIDVLGLAADAWKAIHDDVVDNDVLRFLRDGEIRFSECAGSRFGAGVGVTLHHVETSAR